MAQIREIFQIKKQALVRDMKSVMEKLYDAGQDRVKYANALLDYTQSLYKLALSQAPQSQSYLDEIMVLVKKLYDAQIELGNEEIMNAEDYRDVVERFDVVYRSNEEYEDASKAFDKATEDLNKAIAKNTEESKKLSYEKNHAKLEADIQKAKDGKKAALENLKNKIQAAIDIRHKYGHFRFKRYTDGWSRYGQALKKEGEQEAEVLSKIQDCFKELQSHMTISPEKLNQMESALQQHIDQKPAAVDSPAMDADSSAAAPAEASTQN